jgi:hypothetical protein
MPGSSCRIRLSCRCLRRASSTTTCDLGSNNWTRRCVALLGANDAIVPVQGSAEVFRCAVRPDLLDLRIVPDADHRFQANDEFVARYPETITGFVATHLRRLLSG